MGVHGGGLVLEMAQKVTTLQTLCGIPKSQMEAGNIRELDLVGSDRRKLEEGGTHIFAHYLRSNRFKLKHRLTEVDLSHNSIGFEEGGTHIFAHYLRSNRFKLKHRLAEVDLSQ